MSTFEALPFPITTLIVAMASAAFVGLSACIVWRHLLWALAFLVPFSLAYAT